MRLRPLALVAAFAVTLGIVLPLAPTPGAEAAPVPASMPQGTIVDRDVVTDLSAVFTAINEYRASKGKRELRFMPELHAVAQDWSFELGRTDQFKHRSGFMSRYPAGASGGGEIIAWRRDANAAAMVTQWINSDPHRAQLLGDFTAMGVGVASASGYLGSSRTSLIGTTNFAKYVGSSQPKTYASVEEWVRAGGTVARPPSGSTEFLRIDARNTMQASVDISVARNAPSQVAKVYLAPSHVYFESLVAAPAAARSDRALLLVDPSGPSSALLGELRRLNPRAITVLGAPDVFSEASFRAVRSAVGAASVTRVAGANAPEISANFARSEFSGATHAYVAAERNLSDSISASSAAAAQGVPLVLTPRSTSIPSSIRSYFSAARLASATVVGGSPDLAAAQQRAIRDASNTSATLVRKRDRFLTNEAALRTAWSGPQQATYLASALRFGHAFVGSAIAVGDGPVALTSIGCVPPGPHSFVTQAVDPGQVIALGREWTVSDNAAVLGRCAR